MTPKPMQPTKQPFGDSTTPARKHGTFRTIIRLLVLCLAGAPVIILSSQGPTVGTLTYTVTDLGSLGGSTIEAKGINNFGAVVGCGRIPSEDTHAFLFTTSGGLVDLQTLGGNTSCATGINDAGLITGYSTVSEFPNYRQAAFLRPPQGMMRELPSLGGDSVGSAINQQGQVVGSSATQPGGGVYHAFRVSGTAVDDLNTLGGQTSGATAINAAGQAAGTSDTAAGPSHAFFYTPGLALEDLSALTGFQSNAYGMNDAGDVVGSFLVTTPQWIEERAFVYRKSTGPIDIGNLGGSYGTARDINNRGEVVGDAITPDESAQRAVWYTVVTGWVDLNSLVPANSGWELEVATAINDRGQIVGSGRHNGQRRAFLLTPSAASTLAVTLVPANSRPSDIRSLASQPDVINSKSSKEIVLVSVTGSQDLSGRSIRLAVSPADTTSSGHAHVGDALSSYLGWTPAFEGGVSGSSGCVLDTNARCTVTMFAPPASGRYAVNAETSDMLTRATTTLDVGIALEQLVGASCSTLATTQSYCLSGATTSHPDNHWATYQLILRAAALAAAYVVVRSPITFLDESVGINDLSLARGGLFDLPGDFTDATGHRLHRFGRSLDVDTSTWSTSRVRRPVSVPLLVGLAHLLGMHQEKEKGKIHLELD